LLETGLTLLFPGVFSSLPAWLSGALFFPPMKERTRWCLFCFTGLQCVPLLPFLFTRFLPLPANGQSPSVRRGRLAPSPLCGRRGYDVPSFPFPLIHIFFCFFPEYSGQHKGPFFFRRPSLTGNLQSFFYVLTLPPPPSQFCRPVSQAFSCTRP